MIAFEDKKSNVTPSKGWLVKIVASFATVAICVSTGASFLSPEVPAVQLSKAPACLNPAKIVPEIGNYHPISYFRSPEYKNHSLEVWSGAVKIPTQTYDDIGDIGVDPRWEVFYTFEDYLLKTFPLVSKNSQLDHVNTHGLVFTFEGSNDTLKPLMLTAHQDVVPVPNNTLSRWKYPPFDGHYDGKYLWGRGASDCKNNLVGIFEALEALFEKGFAPQRKIILAFGFDEEASGRRGAKMMSQYLQEKYGDKPMFLVLDEGGMGVQDIYGTRFALPSTGEKGYLDVSIDLITNGGHSSVPPKRTSIGVISDVISLLDQRSAALTVSPKSPYYFQLQCEATYCKDIPSPMKIDILSMESNGKARERVLAVLEEDMITKAMAGTTQAIDVINGGLKINSLPEKVALKINYRIAYESSVEYIKHSVYKTVSEIAAKYGLDVHDFGSEVAPEEFDAYPNGAFYLDSDMDLSPAPVTTTWENPSWDLLGGTLRQVFEDFAIYPDADPSVEKEVIVSPSLMTGNTDIRHYWAMSDNLYRFTPIRHFARKYAHAIGEHIELDAHLDGVAFYHQFFLNVDAYSGN